MQVTAYEECLKGELEYTEDLSRHQFEQICDPVLQNIIQPLDEAFQTAGIEKSAIDNIILVGGSTRIPYVRQKLSEYFGGRAVNLSGNPDEDVALGAAILGHMIATGASTDFFEDVTSLGFGIEAFDRATDTSSMNIIIPRNSRYPVSFSKKYKTVSDNQTRLCINLL